MNGGHLVPESTSLDKLTFPMKVDIRTTDLLDELSVSGCSEEHAKRALLAEFPPWDDDYILFDDSAESGIMVVFKPPGISTSPDMTQVHRSLKTDLSRALGGAPVHMPSRLDFSTQGVVLVARANVPGASSLAHKLVAERGATKTYLMECDTDKALAWRPDPRSGAKELLVDFPIARTAHNLVRRAIKEPGDEMCLVAKDAESWFRASGCASSYCVPGDNVSEPEPRTSSLVWAKLGTGRTHQLRIHAHALGMPILNDGFYDGPTAVDCAEVDSGDARPLARWNHGRLRLMSYELSFHLPQAAGGSRLVTVRVPERLLPKWSVQAVAERLRERWKWHV